MKDKKQRSEPPFRVGQVVDPTGWNIRTVNTLQGRVLVPCKVLNVVQSARYVSGWGITVETDKGYRTLDSYFFSAVA
jgi:hypothetical protein